MCCFKAVQNSKYNIFTAWFNHSKQELHIMLWTLNTFFTHKPLHRHENTSHRRMLSFLDVTLLTYSYNFPGLKIYSNYGFLLMGMFLLLGNLCNGIPQNLDVNISINHSECWCVLILTSKLNSPANPLTPSPLQGAPKAAATITTPGRADKQLYLWHCSQQFSPGNRTCHFSQTSIFSPLLDFISPGNAANRVAWTGTCWCPTAWPGWKWRSSRKRAELIPRMQ